MASSSQDHKGHPLKRKDPDVLLMDSVKKLVKQYKNFSKRTTNQELINKLQDDLIKNQFEHLSKKIAILESYFLKAANINPEKNSVDEVNSKLKNFILHLTHDTEDDHAARMVAHILSHFYDNYRPQFHDQKELFSDNKHRIRIQAALVNFKSDPRYQLVFPDLGMPKQKATFEELMPRTRRDSIESKTDLIKVPKGSGR